MGKHIPATCTPTSSRHVFTSIAPEDADISDKYKDTWKWCIRCGVLRLGQKYFRPSPYQKRTINDENTILDKNIKIRSRR